MNYSPYTVFVVEAFQSNGTDFGEKIYLPSYLQGPQENFYTFFKPADNDINNGEIQKFYTGINTYVEQTDDIFFGVAATCCYKLANTYNRNVVNMNTCIGGTHMYPSSDGKSWNINVPDNLTLRMLNRFLKPAIKAANPYNYEIHIVWVGGESDAGNSTVAPLYENNFQDVMNYIWNIFPNAKMHVSQLKATVAAWFSPEAATIRAANVNLAANNPGRVFLIETAGLTLRALDNLHYDNPSFQALGILFADSINNNYLYTMSNSKANTFTLTLGTTSLEYTRQPTASNTTELMPKGQIVSVNPVKISEKPVGAQPNEWGYRFNKTIQVDILFSDGGHFIFDIQEVTNQPAWTANLAGQQQCVADINAWL